MRHTLSLAAVAAVVSVSTVAAAQPALPPPVLPPTLPAAPDSSGAPTAPAAPATPAAPAAPAVPTTSGGSGSVEFMSLRLMLQKGLITQAEYDSAVQGIVDTTGAKGAAESTNFVVGKWSTTLYGFAEGDYIYDTTQSYSDLAGSGLVARDGSYAGDHSRMQFSPRNSRLGLRFRAPESHGIRASAQFESDFVVDQVPGPPQTNGWTITENNFFTNPVLRIRHFFLKTETPIVDLLFGQTWHLFGWQGTYHPNTVQYQGVPGELYARSTQLRISKTIKTDDITFDIAVAAMRPPNRDSGVPEGEGGIHLAVNKWTATQTMGATGTTISPLSIAVTGDLRQFAVPEYSLKPVNQNKKSTGAVAGDVFIPVLPGTKEDMGNSLSLLGEAVDGYGIVDLYTGMGTGVTWPTPPLPAGAPAPYPGTYNNNGYNPDMDPGYVSYNQAGQLEALHFRSYRLGLQYYFPGLNGDMWLSANYSHVELPNGGDFISNAKTGYVNAGATGILDHLDWYDVNLMGNMTSAVRLGLELANYKTTYQDQQHASDIRVQASAFYIF